MVVEVSKAPEEMSVDTMEKHVKKWIYAMRRKLHDDGKLVTRTYKVLFGHDIKVFADWVVLGEKPTKHLRRKRERESPAVQTSAKEVPDEVAPVRF